MSNIENVNTNSLSFEDFKNENGITYWWASDLMKMLDYKDMKSFQKAIEKAIKTCMTLNIPYYDNFIQEFRDVKGELQSDYKLTRFACYLTVMNADNKKEPVAAAQIYFAEQTRRFELYIQNSNEIERIQIRDEIKEGFKTLQSTAKKAGVANYSFFMNAGIRGMYNMYNINLAKKRKIQAKELMEYMGRTELAANLFRITQTEERIKSHNIAGQSNLEKTHFDVGSDVRKIVIENTGRAPEDLPVEKKIPELQKELKKGYKLMRLEDEGNKKCKKKK